MARRTRHGCRRLPGVHVQRGRTDRRLGAAGGGRLRSTATDPDVRAASEPAREDLSVARDLVTLYRRLSGTAAQSADVSAVTDLLAARLDAPVWIVTDSLAVIVGAGTDRSPTEEMERMRSRPAPVRWDRILQVAAETGSAVRSPESADGRTMIVAPITVDFDVVAYLMTVEHKPLVSGDFALLATEHAATVCGVMLSRERALSAAAGRAREDLVEALLLGRATDADELGRWARHLGLDTSVPLRVMLVVATSPDVGDRGDVSHRSDGSGVSAGAAARVGDVVKHFCESRGAGVVTVVRENEVVVLLPDDPAGGPTAAALGAECLDYCRDLFPGVRVTVGLSAVCSGAADLSRAYHEAWRTVNAARRLQRHSEVVTFESLGILRLLLQLPDLAELSAFVDEVLGDLLRYDAAHSSHLVETLAALFHDGPNVRSVAEALHVHPNTVSYRLRRIADITGLDLASHRDRLMAMVTLEIVEVMGVGGE